MDICASYAPRTAASVRSAKYAIKMPHCASSALAHTRARACARAHKRVRLLLHNAQQRPQST